MNTDKLRQASNLVALAVTIGVNGLANALPLNGQTTGQISDKYPVYFVPAGYVFSIWGLIYLGLLAFGIYQALPAQRENPRLRRVGPWFVLSCIANSVWIFMWHYELLPLSLLVIVALLGTLVMIYLRLNDPARGARSVSLAERWLVQLPFSIYLGWATVATIANATTVLYAAGWTGAGLSGPIWTALLLVIATVIGALMSVRRGDVAFVLVLLWAFIGIGVKHADTPIVVYAAAATALVVAALGGVAVLRSRQLGQLVPRAA